MNRQDTELRIRDIGIVPVVRAASDRHALAAVAALQKGGIPIVEITMTVPGALEVIRSLARTSGAELLIGAGTVLDAESAKRCVDAGAAFLVSPGLDLEMVKAARALDVLVLAGALTPSEIMAAMNAGADLIKVFPCSQVGGPAYIKALRGPFPTAAFVPTGGVNLANASEFLKAGSVALGVGGELVDKAALESGRTEKIVQNARRFIEIVQETRAQSVATATRN